MIDLGDMNPFPAVEVSVGGGFGASISASFVFGYEMGECFKGCTAEKVVDLEQE